MSDAKAEGLSLGPIEICWESLYKEFCLIFDTIDYEELYNVLHLHSYNIIIKGKSRKEIKGIVLALWHLCLVMTFGDEGEGYFLKSIPVLYQDKRITKELESIYAIYWEQLQIKENKDFSPPAELLYNRFSLQKRGVHVISLALYFRSIYEYIYTYFIDLSVEEVKA